MEQMVDKRGPDGRFVAGHRGGPGRRTNAERDAQQDLAQSFVEDVRDDWRLFGAEVLAEVRETKPDQYLRVITAILPKTIELKGGVEVTVVSLLEDIHRETRAAVVEGEVVEESPVLGDSPASGEPMDLPPIESPSDEPSGLLDGI